MNLNRFLVTAATRALMVGFLAILAGCSTPGVTLNYSPSSVKTAQGVVEVGDFKYSAVDPKTAKPIAQNQIRNTAMGDVIIDRDVSKFVRDAVFAELRFVGVKVMPHQYVLTGNIEDFLIDDLGYSIDWTYRVKYTLAEKATGKPLYDTTKNVQRKTAKFGNPIGALNETVRISVEMLLDDPGFMKIIGQSGT